MKENKPTVHRLKIAPQYFKDVVSGVKTFEVRRNDRDFKVGDIVTLEEYKNGNYTSNYVNAEITYILDDLEYCKEGYVVFGIKLLLNMGAHI